MQIQGDMHPAQLTQVAAGPAETTADPVETIATDTAGPQDNYVLPPLWGVGEVLLRTVSAVSHKNKWHGGSYI